MLRFLKNWFLKRNSNVCEICNDIIQPSKQQSCSICGKYWCINCMKRWISSTEFNRMIGARNISPRCLFCFRQLNQSLAEETKLPQIDKLKRDLR